MHRLPIQHRDGVDAEGCRINGTPPSLNIRDILIRRRNSSRSLDCASVIRLHVCRIHEVQVGREQIPWNPNRSPLMKVFFVP
jgi:hypothetical protein